MTLIPDQHRQLDLQVVLQGDDNPPGVNVKKLFSFVTNDQAK
jgi:hypothetical protein